MSTTTGLDARLVARRGPDFVLDVSLRIPAGRTVALLGPNGAGKSTTVAALAGLLPLDDGWVRLDGEPLDVPERDRFVPPERRRIGVVFQDYVLFPHLDGVENVAFGLRSRGVGHRAAREAAERWLVRLGIGDLGPRRPADLSGGQAQRVALARALITEPRLLLLDEPLAALDVTTRAELRRLLAEHLEGFDGPRLLITHDPAEAFLLAEEIHVLERGTVTQSGTSEDIRLRPKTPYVADLAGVNFLTGTADDGVVTTADHRLRIAETGLRGPVVATLHPRAIALHLERPEGSPRNTWATTIVRIERAGERVRLELGAPLALIVEVTPNAVAELRLAVGSAVWVSIKATEIHVETA